MLTADWNQLLAAFKQKYGEHLHDTVLPAQSCFEAFEEKLSDGNLRTESLNHVVSVAEQEEQEYKKAEPQPIQTKRSLELADNSRTVASQVQGTCELLAHGSDETAWKAPLLRLGPQYLRRLPRRPPLGKELPAHQEFRTESRHPPRLVSLHGLRARIEEGSPSAGQGERIPNPACSVGCLR